MIGLGVYQCGHLIPGTISEIIECRCANCAGPKLPVHDFAFPTHKQRSRWLKSAK